MEFLRVYMYDLFLKILLAFAPSSAWKKKEKLRRTDFLFNLYIGVVSLYGDVLGLLQQESVTVIHRFQKKRLRRILLVARNIVWWKKYFENNLISFEDKNPFVVLKKIPPVNKNILLEVSKVDLTSGLVSGDKVMVRKTSGTTGTPFVWEMEDSAYFVSVYGRYSLLLEENGLSFKKFARKNFYVLFNFSRFGPLVEFFGQRLFLRDSSEEGQFIKNLNSLIKTTGDFVLFTNPIELLSFVSILKKNKVLPPIKLVTTVGWILHPDVKKIAHEYLKCPIISSYGISETSLIALGCFAQGGLHIQMERFVVEILDDNGNLVEDGEIGNVTITTLDNIHAPLIRYQPGDIGRMINIKKCECGSSYPLLEIEERVSNFIVFSDGSRELAAKIGRLTNIERYFVAVKRMQVKQVSLNKLEVLIEATDKWSSVFKEEIRERVRRICSYKLDVEVKTTTFTGLGESKFQFFIPLKKL